MALSSANLLALTSSGVAHGTGTWTPTSFTPSNGKRLLVRLWALSENDDALAGSDLTITDSMGPLTWTVLKQSTSADSPGYGYAAKMWISSATTSASSMSLTFDAGAFNVHRYAVVVDELTGEDSVQPGATALGTDADGEGAASITLDAAPASTSIIFAMALRADNTGSAAGTTAGTGWTEDADLGGEASWGNFHGQQRTGTTSTTVGWDDLNSGAATPVGALMMAVEIREADTTGPVLTSPTGTPTAQTTANVGATTDEGNGTLYAVVTTGSTQPSVAQIKAGQDSAGAAAAWSGSVAVSSTGAKTLGASGLAVGASYYAHLVQTDASANDSNRVSSAQFTTLGGGWVTTGTGPRAVPVIGGGPIGAGTVGHFTRGTATGGASSLPAGLAVETDTAFALTARHIAAAGLAVEADTALARPAVLVRAAGLASEADTALALGAVQRRAAGLASETDTALAAAAVHVRAAGLATETDTALALSAGGALSAGLATEVDTAFALPCVQIRAAGLATEADSAFALVVVQAKSAGLAIEVDTAFARTAVLAIGAGLAVETDTALVPGAMVWPDPATVLVGVVYGPTGVEYTGTLRPVTKGVKIDIATGRKVLVLNNRVVRTI